MNAQIKYYHTVKETMSCDCGEARLMSEMLKTTLPCSHLFSLGVPFPEIQPPKIERFNRTGGELFVEYKFIKSEEVKIDHDYYIGIRNHVYKQIKRFSHNKDKDKIMEFVNHNLPFKETIQEFILGYPAETFSVIDKGIAFFYKEKKK